MTRQLRKTDHQLKVQIIDELAWTPSVNADRIGVWLADGAVVLSGQVLSYPEKAAAAAAVLRIRGVTAVADEIEVRPSIESKPREDADVAREAGSALDRTVVIPAGAVKATVRDQAITLSGTVDWHYEREAAHRAVAGLPGVREVHNTITLTPSIAVSQTDAKAKITAALVRNARLDAKHVAVDVADSTITLTGTVSSWAERSQAEHAAWSTPGAVYVRNELTVTPDESWNTAESSG